MNTAHLFHPSYLTQKGNCIFTSLRTKKMCIHTSVLLGIKYVSIPHVIYYDFLKTKNQKNPKIKDKDKSLNITKDNKNKNLHMSVIRIYLKDSSHMNNFAIRKNKKRKKLTYVNLWRHLSSTPSPTKLPHKHINYYMPR